MRRTANGEHLWATQSIAIKETSESTGGSTCALLYYKNQIPPTSVIISQNAQGNVSSISEQIFANKDYTQITLPEYNILNQTNAIESPYETLNHVAIRFRLRFVGKPNPRARLNNCTTS